MDELASWGLGEFGTGEGTPVYDGPKYSHSSAPSHYEPSIKYGPPSGGPPPPYAEKYVKRVDENQVRSEYIFLLKKKILPIISIRRAKMLAICEISVL